MQNLKKQLGIKRTCSVKGTLVFLTSQLQSYVQTHTDTVSYLWKRLHGWGRGAEPDRPPKPWATMSDKEVTKTSRHGDEGQERRREEERIGYKGQRKQRESVNEEPDSDSWV